MEWSDASYNICTGCRHGCLYCYAKAMRSRFDESVRHPGNWERQRLRSESKLGADMRKKGVVMFPTTHDIFPEILPEAVATIRNLINGGNRVLVVSKPHLEVVERLCREFTDYKAAILLRFSIGSRDRKLTDFWEPGAPAPEERLQSLRHAFASGFSTSVSMEPMLDSVDRMIELVGVIEPHVTDSIWLGKMQRIPRKLNAHVDGFSDACRKIREDQRDEEILRLVRLLAGRRKIRWKDSIKAVIDKAANNN